MKPLAFNIFFRFEWFKNQQLLFRSDAEMESVQFLVEANDKSERVWSVILKYGATSVIAMVNILAFSSISYCWITRGHLDVKYFYNPAKFRFETFSAFLLFSCAFSNK